MQKGDFTASVRLLWIAALAIGIGASCAYVATALLWLIGVFTQLFYFPDDFFAALLHHPSQLFAIELVSPANKDRPESRRAFVAKCAALLQQRVSVAIVDFVTIRQFNLYDDLLDLIGQSDPSMANEPPSLYAAACRWRHQDNAWHFETWAHPLSLQQPLPTLPLWLADNFAVPLELEPTYVQACGILRIA